MIKSQRKGTTMDEAKVKMRWSKDTRRYHAFEILDADGSVGGTLYFRRESFMNGTPKRVVVESVRKDEAE